MRLPTFDPTWYTTEDFAEVRPISMYHREQEPDPADPAGIRNYHVLARADLTIDVPVGSVLARITADDYYKLYINGEFVCQGPASGYPEHYYYNTVDIARWLHPGQNVLAVHLYYQGLLNRVWNSRDGRMGVCAQVCLLRGDGTLTGCVEPAWRYRVTDAYGMGATVGYDTQFMEHFDSRAWDEGWVREGYDDSSWTPMVPAAWADYHLESQPTKMLEHHMLAPRSVETLAAPARATGPQGADAPGAVEPLISSATSTDEPRGQGAASLAASQASERGPQSLADGSRDPVGSPQVAANGERRSDVRVVRVDFGREVTATLALTARGRAGDVVTIRCGEELNDDGSVRFAMRCNCVYEEAWTLADGICTLDQYDYKAFRYVELLLPWGVELQAVRALERHYPLDESLCTVESSDEWLAPVFQICKRGVELCSQEQFVDCPSREKGQYPGDSVVVSLAQAYLSGSVELMDKAIEQFAQTAALVDDGLMAVAPGSLMQEIADFSLMYGLMVWHRYELTGDVGRLRRSYPVVRGAFAHFGRYVRADGLLEQVADKWNLVDWPENLRDGYDFALTRPVVAPGCHNVVNALYVGAARTLTQVEDVLGEAHSVDWQALRDAYQQAFFRPEAGLFADSETSAHAALHSNLYPLFFGLCPEGSEGRVADFLLERGLRCGVLLSYFYLKGLARIGRYRDVFATLVNESEHGWVNMLCEGATTCWEAWGAEQKWNTSLCHAWACAPIPVLVEDVAGLVPDPAAERGFRFEPHVPAELAELTLTVPFRGSVWRVRKGAETGGEVTLEELRRYDA